ncbi:MAG: HD domain-containing protein [Bacteroidales bacterium]|nr:HD domain-containing protein [Bacteroidales bacterium]
MQQEQIEPKFTIPDSVKQLIDKYYKSSPVAYHYYYTHCIKVTELALEIAERKKDYQMDHDVIIACGMLHDIGIIKTNAPDIGCFGEYPYISHIYLGREMLEQEGFADIAPICERHVGTGLSKEDIIKSNFPLPHRDMLPITLEEKLICYADKFYSKSEKHLTTPRSLEEIRKKVVKYGENKLGNFDALHELFN